MSMPLTTKFEVEGATETISQARAVYEALKQGIPLNKELAESWKATRQTVLETRRVFTITRTEIRNTYVTLIETARVLNDIGRIGRTIVSMWTAYTMGMIRVERAQRDVKDATKSVAEWQALYNQYLRDFGADSAYTLDALANLDKALADQEEAQKAVHKAQQDMIMGYVGMGLETIGLIGTIPTIIVHFKEMRSILATTGVTASGVAKAIGTTALSITAFVGAFMLGEEILRRIPEEFRPIASALMAIIGTIVAATVAWIALHTAMSGIMAPITAAIILGAIGFAVAGVKGLIGLEKGGLVLHPTVALIGEKEPEAVIPLSKMAAGGGVREVNIINYFGSISSVLDLEDAGNVMYRQLMRRLEAKW